MKPLVPLPSHDNDIPWPTKEWPIGESDADLTKLQTLIEPAFTEKTAELGDSFALVVVQRGKLVLERYGPMRDALTPCPSWSMAKSITHALIGILAKRGLIDIHAPADVPEWRGEGDPRGKITLDQLLRMSSGLAFNEEYVVNQGSDVVQMLWGQGKTDVAKFAASFPLEHEPGSFFSYSSGTTNIVSRCAARALGGNGPEFERFMHESLFDPIGMTSAEPGFDAAGTFIGSSFCFATPRDFAKFGYLYLRDGIWENKRLLPEGWVDYARTPTWQQPGVEEPYGAHWWLGLAGSDSFSANGYEGQHIVIVPQKDLVLVRNGRTTSDKKENVMQWITGIIQCFS